MDFREITAHVEIDQAVTVDVRPHRAVGVHPPVESGHDSRVLEGTVAQVPVQALPAPHVDEDVLESVVVVIPPHRAHGHAPVSVHIGQAGLSGDLHEAAVALVPVQGVRRPFAAAGRVQVLPPVVIEIHDRDGCPEGRDMGHDRLELRIEYRLCMDEVNTGCRRRIGQQEPVPARVRRVRLAYACLSYGRITRQPSVEKEGSNDQNDEKDSSRCPYRTGGGW